MGEVYRARDTKLGREVAVKILPDEVAADPERLARFDREAKLLASLNHPNIAALYSFDHVDRRHLLVMELAEGEDLSSRINRGAIPIEDALPIAIQIARALEGAHDQVIMHRDLKPANIKVTPDGAVKVLDFGLARAFSNDPSDSSSMNSPTLTASPTRAGMILGTAAYMSPEQARGRTADKRADIWSFGVVLFEMLTGARLFPGETMSDTLAGVLRLEIDWKALPPDTPRPLRQVLKRCLERDRNNRLHDIADARIVLDDITRGAADDVIAAPAPAPVRAGLLWPIAAGLVIAALASGAILSRVLWPARTIRAAAAMPLTRLTIPLWAGLTDGFQGSVSADGRFVVFTGVAGTKRELYVQRFDEATPRRLERTEGASQPFLSPDGGWVGFRRANKLERIAIDGGDPLVIADAPSAAPGAEWNTDGNIVLSLGWLGGLGVVPASGGTVRTIATPDAAKGEIGFWYPHLLPDGDRVLYTVFRAATGLNDAGIAVLDLRTGRSETLGPGADASFVPPGYLVFYRAGAYQVVRVDPVTLARSGEPARVLNDARGLPPDGDNCEMRVAGTTVVYRPGPILGDVTLHWVAEGGKTEPLPFPPKSYGGGSLSPDRRRLAATVLESGRLSTHLLNLDNGISHPLEIEGAAWRPIFDPDGQRLALRVMRQGNYDTYIKRLDVVGSAEPVAVSASVDESPLGWTANGASLFLDVSEPDGRYRTKLIDPGDPKSLRTIWDQPSLEAKASPDGRWWAFVSRHTGSPRVYLMPANGTGVPEPITRRGGAIAWSRTKHELLYAHDQEIIAVTYRDDAGRFRVESERVWARLPVTGVENVFEMGTDGRMLISMPATPPLPAQLRVILGWDQELERVLSKR